MTLHLFPYKRKFGLADETGRVHVGPIYDQLEPLIGGRHAFYRDFKRGFLDDQGHPVITGPFNWAQSFAYGWSVASQVGGTYGLLDLDGNWGLEPNYAGLRAVSEALALAKPMGGSTWGLLEIKTGAWRIAPAWKEFQEGYGRIAVKTGSKYAGIDLDGKEWVAAQPRKLLQPSGDGTWIAQDKNKGPFQRLSATGEVLQTYADGVEVRPFNGVYACAQRDKRWGLIDISGTWVVEPISSHWLQFDPEEPIRVRVGEMHGYVRPNQGLIIPATFAEAGHFIDGHTVADMQVIDRSGNAVAKISPAQPPVVLPPPPPPKGAAAKALVARFPRKPTFRANREVVARISTLPDPDIVAVLHAWYTGGMPWISLGDWDVWTTTYGQRLEDALRDGKSTLPFGHGAYNDPINLRFPKGRLEIGIDSNPDDTRPRKFSSLQAFADAMVIDALFELEDDNEAWPLPDWLHTWFAAGGLSASANKALEEHIQRVAARGGAPGDQAAAWLKEHGTPAPVPTEHSMAFEPCETAATHPEAPAEIAALLGGGGHLYYIQGSRWVAVTNKGIRFANDKGKRQAAGLTAVTRMGPAVAVVGDVALIAGHFEAMQVDLTTGKKHKLFERPFGEVATMCPAPDGTAFVAVPRSPDHIATSVRIHDLAGEVLRDIATPDIRFIKGAIPLWDGLVAVVHMDGVVVIDVSNSSVAAVYKGSVQDGRAVGHRFTLSLWSDKHLELRKH